MVDEVRRGDGGPAPGATTELDGRSELAAQLAALGAHGELVLHDGACGERVLSLPALTDSRSELACTPLGVRSPDGRLVARCLGDETEVFQTADGGLHSIVPGCAPAWQPDGTLTAALDGDVVRFQACRGPDACPVTVIPRAGLERAARRHPTVPDRIARVRALIDGVAWLSPRRAAVGLSLRLGGRFEGLGPLSAIVFFEGGMLTSAAPYYRVTGGRLAASPRGSYVTQTPDVILRPDGSQVSLPPLMRDARDFAWSPDERFLAIAGRYAVAIVDVASLERYDRTGGGLRSVTIPQPAARLAWRST